ncbi:unnamed protein product [Eruca vesicaria subsp. sativa]|uniref:Uncharacterized protein n=1 Tax=Eruca vesicaria subsp. sativa TaxID=29727 RepID=A0ABC8L820_ERUVS|nr:unnamed protein product [Eruca vesicaria subsp. sativa]
MILIMMMMTHRVELNTLVSSCPVVFNSVAEAKANASVIYLCIPACVFPLAAIMEEEEEVGIQAELDLYEGIPQHDMVLAKLEKFKQSISAKPFGSSSSSEPGGGNTEEEDVSDWKNVNLKFAPEHGK